MAGESGGPATLTASFVPKYFGRLKREEEAKIPLLSCTESLSYKRLNKYPGQFRQNFVNPLKACKIGVECGCFPLRRLWWCCCCSVEVRSWLLLSTVGLVYSFCSCGAAQGPQNPDRECVLWGAGCAWAGLAHGACPCAASKPCRPGSIWILRAVWNQVKTSGTNSTDKVFKSPPLFLLLGNPGQHTTL